MPRGLRVRLFRRLLTRSPSCRSKLSGRSKPTSGCGGNVSKSVQSRRSGGGRIGSEGGGPASPPRVGEQPNYGGACPRPAYPRGSAVPCDRELVLGVLDPLLDLPAVARRLAAVDRRQLRLGGL